MASAQASGPTGCGLAGGEAAGLDLHEGLSPAPRKGCVCGPEHLRLRSEHGELVRPRGKSVNRCDYCARLAAVENCEMLALDALEGDPATVLLVLTTRTVTVDMAGFAKGLERVRAALKRVCPAVEYACLLEFTTGYGPRSRGARRPHWNLMLKGVPNDAWSVHAVQAIAAATWCRRELPDGTVKGYVDAEPAGQHATAIYAGEGLTRYLALHFQKASQEPPAGFKGQRFNCSRGYFTGCTRAQARARAREALLFKRELWRQIERFGGHSDSGDVERIALASYKLARSTRWVLANEQGSRLSEQRLPTMPALDRLQLVAGVNGISEGRTTSGRMAGAPSMRDRLAVVLARRRALTDGQLAGGWLPDRELLLFASHDGIV